MTIFAKRLAFAVALLVAIAQLALAKMQIWVYSGQYLGADRWSVKFSYTQKCYTFSSCFDEDTVGADWVDINDSLAMVFYEKEQCQGAKQTSHAIPKGQTMFTFDKGAKSFMVWSYGMYATNGIEHECLERAMLNTTNTTSGSSMEAGDIIIPN
ncbi:hypothetical protein PHYPSEUDO_004793 [Phytophthora pseudosyringae]|uniref:Uncharacterized protein n=1 Tax=Phytophthora pseudosyringae TaxID=221518 RepID=A0A8T1VNP3_9STRA|nr:hypothetical protein PHYPSEUDO_004793 [Phytophthora pseudosyringae]